MINPSPARTWINVVALIAATTLASEGRAQSPHSLVDRGAEAVRVGDVFDDAYDAYDAAVGDDIAQVGFFDRDHGGSSCDGCGNTASGCCCTPWWAHRTGGFGQFLLLRPGNADQIYTIEQNSTTAGSSPTGQVGRLNIDEEAGFRVGFTLAASDCTSLVASFTHFESNTSNTISRTGSNVLNSQIIHPSTLTVGSSSLQSSADYNIDFELIDLAYRHILKASDTYAINWLAGFRYGNMEQDLLAQQEISVATGLVSVDTDVDFYGFGMMFGLDGERRSCDTGLMIYGRGLSSFLAGDWQGHYRQTNQTGGGVVANDYEDYRVTPVLELELGFGWQSDCGRWRATAGYLTSAWYDAISTRQYVDAVRSNNYVNIDETITFSGLTAAIEGRF